MFLRQHHLIFPACCCASAVFDIVDDAYVTCGSAVKITHVESGQKGNQEYFLNSETKNLGSGSGQQIVTVISNPTTTNTLWWIRGADEDRAGLASDD